ncbi:uncharacterized protein PRCAT00001040001 [Priceomyces carsonii]|uniref:uncharacterized protein n=1 Tax=Priceomyces carsonii TaxID=28549 RepID=UPI002ED8AE36|nr:unnamed protein product [Priceomyces carsonii]
MSKEVNDLKLLFIGWLEEAAIEATKKGTKAALLYNKALDRVRHHEGPINDPKTLKLIQYVGEKTVLSLTNRLRKYCLENGVRYPEAFDPATLSVKDKRTAQITKGNDNKRPRKQKPYVPRQRSGGYAILIALYLRDKGLRGLSKDEIIKVATPYCDRSFKSNPSNSDFYSAWDSIKILIKHDLVGCMGRSPKLYVMTEEGLELASKLKEAEGINSSPPRSSATDISFDNEIRVSPFIPTRTVLSDFSKLGSESKEQVPIFEDYNPSATFLFDSNFASSPLKNRSSMSNDNIQRQESKTIQALNDSKHHDIANKLFQGIQYDIWLESEFEIILLIDNREIRSQQERDFFRQRLESLGIQCEVRSLSVGDSLWIARRKKTKREVVLNYICERKKLDDLAFSIKDGRFQEQKNRLKKTGMKYFYYIIEEVGIEKVAHMKDAIRTSMSMTMTTSNFNLKRSKSIEETVSLLATLTNVIKLAFKRRNTNLIVLRPRIMNTQAEYALLLLKFREEFESRSTPYECVHLYSTFQDSLAKNGMMTVREMFVSMLMAIKGVSLERAVTVQSYFKTPKGLLDFYHTEHRCTSDKEKRELLLELFKNQVGNKKIGKVVLERIFETWGTPSS